MILLQKADLGSSMAFSCNFYDQLLHDLQHC